VSAPFWSFARVRPIICDYHTTALIDQDSVEYQKQDTVYRAAEKAFEQHLYFVAVPLGLATIIVGAFLPIPAIGTGLMFSGIFSVCHGYYNYWSELSSLWKFLSLLAAFIVLLVVGYKKVESKEA
jgi:hypothetical protein